MRLNMRSFRSSRKSYPPAAMMQSRTAPSLCSLGVHRADGFELRIDLHRGRRASHQAHAIGHLIDVDAHRHALGKAHPGEDRIYRREPCLIRLRVRDVDATGDAAAMATSALAIAPQRYSCRDLL